MLREPRKGTRKYYYNLGNLTVFICIQLKERRKLYGYFSSRRIIGTGDTIFATFHFYSDILISMAFTYLFKTGQIY